MLSLIKECIKVLLLILLNEIIIILCSSPQDFLHLLCRAVVLTVLLGVLLLLGELLVPLKFDTNLVAFANLNSNGLINKRTQ